MAKAIKHIKAGLLHLEVIGTIPERELGRRRSGRSQPTSAAMQFYNDKCSWRRAELKLAANFGSRDYVAALTYDDRHLPEDRAEAARQIQKLIKDWRKVRKKRGEELRYIYVTEGWHGKSENEYFGGDGRLEDRRLHHHIVFNGVGPGDLEELQSLWRGGGYVRVEPVDVHYYRELAKYLTKEAREFGRPKAGEKVWHPSRNLKEPEEEYIEIPTDGVTLAPPPGAVDYVQFTEKNPYGFADCVGARYLLFEHEPPPQYSYAKGRKGNTSNNFCS